MSLSIDVYDISLWNQLGWYGTKGTRNKFICEHPETGKRYYFKESLKKTGCYYPLEFWSEIIASKVGRFLNFDMVDYNVGYHDHAVGCLSENMLSERQSLMEGFHYLTAVEPSFTPDTDRGTRILYDFQLIEKALVSFGYDEFLPQILDTIIFDAIVGNSDRHQENWGIIFQLDALDKILFPRTDSSVRLDIPRGMTESWRKKVMRFGSAIFLKKEISVDSQPSPFQAYQNNPDKKIAFLAPIYDSGSSLGRELDESKIEAMLRDNMRMQGYINKGLSEIHWQKKKVSHFDLLEHLRHDHEAHIENKVKSLKLLYNAEALQSLIESASSVIPSGKKYEEFRLSSLRRQFLFTSIDLRLQRLFRAFAPTT